MSDHPRHDEPLIAFRVGEGALEPADEQARHQCRQARLTRGRIVYTRLSDRHYPDESARNGGFHRLAHRFAGLCRDNIECYSHLSAHETLKALQSESGVGCERLSVDGSQFFEAFSEQVRQQLGPAAAEALAPLALLMEGVTLEARQPQSLSYRYMSEDRFREVVRGLCAYVARVHWPQLSADAVERMASQAPDEFDG